VKDFPQLSPLEERSEEILNEILVLLGQSEIEQYIDHTMTKGKNKWRTRGIVFWDLVEKETCKLCPITWEILSNIPGLLTASINLLEANTDIRPHVGDTNATVRGHLALVVPSSDPSQCGFMVQGETRPWEEGKLLLFPDSSRHAAWNHTQHPRLLLLFDIIKPQYLAQRRYICSRALSKIHADAFYSRHYWWRRMVRFSINRLMLEPFYRLYFRMAQGFAAKKA
jgi:aspartyl/asparaginyl beta-hydroxylase (cupin superfamily)